MPEKVYLDDNGEPIVARTAKVYLDDNGNPIGEKHVEKPAPFKSAAGFRGVEAIADAVRGIPDIARNLLNPDARAATLRGAQEGRIAGNRDIVAAGKEELGGAKDFAGGVWEMLKHPVDTASSLAGGVADAARAVPDVARNLANPVARRETIGGFIRGGAEGASGVNADDLQDNPLRAIGGALAMAAGGKVLGSGAKTLKRVGGARTAAAAAKEAARAAEMAELARVANGMATAGDAAEVARVAEGLANGPKPKPAAPQPRVSVAGARVPAVKPEPPAGLPPGREGHFKLPKPRAILTDAQFADVERRINGGNRPGGLPDRRGPRPAPVESAPVVPAAEAPLAVSEPPVPPKAPGISTVSKDGQKVVVRPKPGVVGGMRSLLGSDKAARKLGISPADVKRLAPGPSRRPLAVEMAEMDADYARRIADERGFIDPKAAVKIGVPVAAATVAGGTAEKGEGIQDALTAALLGAAATNPGAVKRGAGKAYRSVYKPARMIGMLSGAALPKSVLGNVGAFINASVDHGTTAPLKQLAKPGAILRDMKDAWKAQSNPAGHVAVNDGAFLSKFNIPGRLMGALDQASENGLIRSGLTKSEAQRQLLTAPGAVTGTIGRGLNTELGQHLVPFQRIPFNSVGEGLLAANELNPKSGATKLQKIATGTAAGAGVAAGTQTDDPVTMALMAALMGRRALPFAGGAVASLAVRKGPSKARFLAERMGTGIPDISLGDIANPLRPITNPAVINWLKYLHGGK